MTQLNSNFTGRELEVLKWMVIGKSDSVIADILNLSAQDMKTHIPNILQILDVDDRIRACLKAIKFGLV